MSRNQSTVRPARRQTVREAVLYRFEVDPSFPNGGGDGLLSASSISDDVCVVSVVKTDKDFVVESRHNGRLSLGRAHRSSVQGATKAFENRLRHLQLEGFSPS